MNSKVLPSFQFGMNCQGFAAARLTWPAYVDGRNLKIALSERITLLLHGHVDVPRSLVVINLTLDDKLCLRDDKNVDFV